MISYLFLFAFIRRQMAEGEIFSLSTPLSPAALCSLSAVAAITLNVTNSSRKKYVEEMTVKKQNLAGA